MEVVLFQPEIPPNTGNVARLCAVTQSGLHLIEPIGFDLENRQLKRAGMDYWSMLRWNRWKDWKSLQDSMEEGRKFWFVESEGPQRYDEVDFGKDDFLVFGRILRSAFELA